MYKMHHEHILLYILKSKNTSADITRLKALGVVIPAGTSTINKYLSNKYGEESSELANVTNNMVDTFVKQNIAPSLFEVLYQDKYLALSIDELTDVVTPRHKSFYIEDTLIDDVEHYKINIPINSTKINRISRYTSSIETAATDIFKQCLVFTVKSNYLEITK